MYQWWEIAEYLLHRGELDVDEVFLKSTHVLAPCQLTVGWLNRITGDRYQMDPKTLKLITREPEPMTGDRLDKVLTKVAEILAGVGRVTMVRDLSLGGDPRPKLYVEEATP